MMIRTSTTSFKSQFHFKDQQAKVHLKTSFSKPRPKTLHFLPISYSKPLYTKTCTTSTKPTDQTLHPLVLKSSQQGLNKDSSSKFNRFIVLSTASLAFAMLLAGFDDHKAYALGPEGPLMEEFWDNMRRYGLYVITVSTGVIYTLSQPIIELLKNPVTAVLIVIVLGGSFYIVSQVLSAMVGVSEFAYEYGY